MKKLQVSCKYAAPYTPTTGGRFEKFGNTIKDMLDAVLMENSDLEVSFAAKLACFMYKWVS